MSEPRSLTQHLLRSVALTGAFGASVLATLGGLQVAAERGVGPFVADLPMRQVDGHDTPAGEQARRVAALDARFACSHTGLPDGVVPARAVVRVGDRVRVVSFDAGWAMYEGRRQGTLLSVCAR